MTGPSGGPTPVFVLAQGLAALGLDEVTAGEWAEALAYDLHCTGQLAAGWGPQLTPLARAVAFGPPTPPFPDPGVTERTGAHRVHTPSRSGRRKRRRMLWLGVTLVAVAIALIVVSVMVIGRTGG